MQTEEILERLIGFPSVVGQSNRTIADWICAYLDEIGAEVTRLTGPEGDRENIFASIGPRDMPGIVLSGHMDVVPADEVEWQSNPFVLRRDGDNLVGRGSCDMKGFLACALSAVPDFSACKLTRPIHLAFSYDEEAGCRGVPHMIARLPDLCAPPTGCIIGEPTGLQPVLAHKGKAAVKIAVRGQSGHSSRPDLGKNAIHAMAKIITKAVEQAQDLEHGAQDCRFAPPFSTLQAGVIRGGSAINIIPELCTAEIEVRAISGVNPESLLSPIRDEAETLRKAGFEIDWDIISSYPALSGNEAAEIVKITTGLAGKSPAQAVSFGTEAGLFEQAGMPAVICGPGDISRAHRPNEYITTGELAACRDMIRGLIPHLCQ
ncbi:acetylornithine deacetylase [Thalassospira sp.]|uniref:acetylornithine deacetylase n=1 Tax=Thalassospira sp. TaxID=1912094 RepID=UPI00273711E6|nr:acetylornithine deacetylase [Thalassospira sp.]MDP2699835.1 acetylornithine deacetylase [Thalassospira sp.]